MNKKEKKIEWLEIDGEIIYVSEFFAEMVDLWTENLNQEEV